MFWHIALKKFWLLFIKNIESYSIFIFSGHGIFMNSSFGQLSLMKTLVSNNKGDGIHMVHGNVNHDLFFRIVNELCYLPTTTSQTFPVDISVHQHSYNAKEINCYKVLTYHFIKYINYNLYFDNCRVYSQKLDKF